MAQQITDSRKIVAQNKQARHDFEIIEVMETGIVLTGTEIKAAREGKANIRDCYADIENGEMWLKGMIIGPYSHTGYAGHDARRNRKLLLHRSEIRRLQRKIQEKGYTAVPLSLYLRRGLLKVELALARGRHQYDKRAVLKEKDLQMALKRGED